MGPLVTVLLPTHNRADVLGVAILSVLSQTVEDFELLIVGDGCTDGTRDVVASFADPRIIWLDLPKAPLSGYANRNIALRQARGHYVAYAQHDDLWFPDHLALLLKAIGEAGADWAYSRPLWVGRNAAIVPSPVNLTLSDEFDNFMAVENSVPSTCVLHTRSALDRVGYWPEDVPSLADWECWRLIIASSAGAHVGFCRLVTCLHFPTIMNNHVGMPERALRDEAESGWWPAILRCPVADYAGQEALWRALRDGGGGWVAAVRAATDTVLDRVALTTMRQSQPMADKLRAAEALAAAYRAEAETVQAELAMRTADAASSRETAGHAIAEAGRARAERDAATADAQAAEAEAQAARAKAQAARAEAQAAGAAAQAARTEARAAKAEAEGAVADARVARVDAQAAADDACAARAAVVQQRTLLNLVYRSRSWRVTAPMRAIKIKLRR